ncbi:MAG: hypothetical protein HYU66_02280 [Armatimonadetes bacterium]|nr:hypothetical protein [Armatimonadota bacterium]
MDSKREELHETVGVPDPLPSEAQGPSRGLAGLPESLLPLPTTSQLGSEGTSQVGATILAATVLTGAIGTASILPGGPPMAALLVLGVLLWLAWRRVRPRIESRRLDRVRERHRRELVSRRARHVSDQAISPAPAADEELGISPAEP